MFLVIIFCAFFICAARAQESARPRKKVVVLFMTPLAFSETCRGKLKGFSYLFERGASGLMNARTAKTGSAASAYITLNASVRAYGSASNMWNTWEAPDILSAGEMYFQNTGMLPLSRNIVNPAVKRLSDENKRNAFPVYVGVLGKVLQEHGLRRAVIGNADTDTEHHREAALFLMDENGLVDAGNVSKQLLMRDEASPFGARTDYKKLFDVFSAAFQKADVLAVDAGDFYRLEEASKIVKEEAWLAQKEKLLKDADAFLLKLISFLNEQSHKQDWALFVLSAQPSEKEREEGNLLTPVFMLANNAKPGLLTSSSTRHAGVISNLDIAPSVLDVFGIQKPGVMIGRPVHASAPPNQDARGFLCAWHPRLVSLSQMNTPILRTLLVVQGALVVFFFFLFVTPKINKQAFIPAKKFALLWGAGQPLFLLLLGAFPSSSWSSALFLFVFLSLFITMPLTLFFKPVHSFLLLAAVTTFLIALDGVRQSPWMMYSALGFSLMGGSRYYGIGNEYMGILLSSSWIAFGLFGDVFLHGRPAPRKFYGSVFCVLYGILFCALIGHPSIGANLDGPVTVLFSLFWLYKELNGLKVRLRTALAACVLFTAFSGALIFIDIQRGESMSHLGRFYLDVHEKGFSVFWVTVARKFSMNLKLIQYTLWTKVLLVCGALLVYLFRKNPLVFKELFLRFPMTAAAMRAVLAGGVVGLLVNDSGIIIATTCVLGLCFTLLYLLFFMEQSPVRNQGAQRKA